MTIGFVGVAFYASHYLDRDMLFGPGGVYGFAAVRANLELSGARSLYAITDDRVYFEVLFHLGIVAAACTFLGIGGRALLASHLALMWSLYMTNPSLMDGGDAVIIAASCFLLLTRCADRFTVLLLSQRTGLGRTAPSIFASTLNNTGVLLLASQLSIVYLMAGLFKVQGRLWQDGTALYYILRVPEFFWPGITPLLFGHPWLLVLGAYGTVLVSIFFPVLIWFRGGRTVAVVSMLVFHIAIGVLMGLTSFALVMVAADCIFVSQHIETGRVLVTRTARQCITSLTRIASGRRESHA